MIIDITWEDVAMKNILFFGDSNTYGYKPDKSGRYDYDVRWTGRIANLLGNEYNIIEEGLCGRTTIFLVSVTFCPSKSVNSYVIV